MKLTTISLGLRNSNSGLPPVGFNIEPLLGTKYAANIVVGVQVVYLKHSEYIGKQSDQEQ